MRLIDADALINDVDGDLLDGIAEARAIEKIENAPTIGGWINVKDRLPEEGVCLGCHGSNVGIYGYSFGEWFDEDDCICGEGYVTHWMPLPKPPKEGENGTQN